MMRRLGEIKKDKQLYKLLEGTTWINDIEWLIEHVESSEQSLINQEKSSDAEIERLRDRVEELERGIEHSKEVNKRIKGEGMNFHVACKEYFNDKGYEYLGDDSDLLFYKDRSGKVYGSSEGSVAKHMIYGGYWGNAKGDE